jgi:hypothetical protein
MEHFAIRRIPRRGKPVQTFSDIRRAAEKRLARGQQIGFDRIMADIAELRTRSTKLVKS